METKKEKRWKKERQEEKEMRHLDYVLKIGHPGTFVKIKDSLIFLSYIKRIEKKNPKAGASLITELDGGISQSIVTTCVSSEVESLINKI